MVAAYLSEAGLGWAILETDSVSDAVGWFAVGFGLLAALGFMLKQPKTPLGAVFEPPVLSHVVPLVIGIALVT
jgi:hypothetical protein